MEKGYSFILEQMLLYFEYLMSVVLLVDLRMDE
jgi:hypothetical protein